MKSKIKLNTDILLICSVIAFASLVYILYQVNTNLVVALNVFHTKFELIHYLVGFGHLFVLLFHIYSILYIFLHFRRFAALRSFKILLLILGVISLFSVGVEKVMVDEIAREYRHGLGINELYILNLAYIINMVFSILVFVFLLKTVKLINMKNTGTVSVDENLFIIGQSLGIISGLTGIWFTIHMIKFVGPELMLDKLWVFMPFYILFLVPYALAILYWLSVKHKQRIQEWYDEKQVHDMLKSAMATLVLSVPGLAVLLLFHVPHGIFWIVYYIFLVLMLFSASTLYFFKLKDIRN
jgi:hypothetical protein